jgi:hypothetical protein
MPANTIVEARAYPRPLPNSDWLGKLTEEILEPDLPIVDPHHHLWDHPGNRYLLDELVWGFSCQVVVFGLLPVLCSERESRSSSRRLRSGSRSARKGSRDRNASKAWRLAALASLVFRSALTPEHAEGR